MLISSSRCCPESNIFLVVVSILMVINTVPGRYVVNWTGVQIVENRSKDRPLGDTRKKVNRRGRNNNNNIFDLYSALYIK